MPSAPMPGPLRPEIQTMQKQWEHLERMVLDPNHASDTQRREMQKAFFAGAFSLYQTITLGVSALPDDEAERKLAEIGKELKDFFRQFSDQWQRRN